MQNNGSTSQLEFIALMAFLMSNVALSIDAILPALTNIGYTINTTEDASLQLIITMIFLGLGVGQLIFGTFSDSFGRKPIIYVGVGLFVVASLICIFAPDIETMLLGRMLQGIGLSAPRTISVSIVRDSYTGDNMARIMSFITVIFILIPMVAPLLGQFILDNFNWQAIFYFQLIFVVVTIVWFWFRQEETLSKADRILFTRRLFIDGTLEFFRHKSSVIYTIISGFIMAAFMVYLSASQQIFQEQYNMVDEFPYIFAALAFVIGISTFINGSMVIKYGMKKLVGWALYLFSITSLIYIIVFSTSSNPGLLTVMMFLFIQFLSVGFLFGNLSALAMQPIGHIAGIGAALNGFISTVMAVPLAIVMGKFISTSVLPLFTGFFICGIVGILLLKLVRNDISMSGRRD